MNNSMLEELIEETFEFGGCAKNGDRGRDGKDGKDGDGDGFNISSEEIAESLLNDII